MESMFSFKDQVRFAIGLILEEIDASDDAKSDDGRAVWLTKCDAVMNNEIAKRMMFAANGFCTNCHKDLTQDIFGREIVERLGLAFIAKSGYGYTVTRKDGRWWCNQMWEVEKFPERPAYADLKTARSALAETGGVNDIRT